MYQHSIEYLSAARSASCGVPRTCTPVIALRQIWRRQSHRGRVVAGRQREHNFGRREFGHRLRIAHLRNLRKGIVVSNRRFEIISRRPDGSAILPCDSPRPLFHTAVTRRKKTYLYHIAQPHHSTTTSKHESVNTPTARAVQ